jgi:hypothetical protein
LVWLWSVAGASRAQAQGELSTSLLRPKQIRVDGDLGDWRGARFARVGQQGDSLRYALGYDDDALYIAARVQDASFIRTARPSPREDGIAITLVAPQGGSTERFTASELWLFAGIPGEQAAIAMLATAHSKPRTLKVSIVEGPLEGPGEEEPGYVLEARIPWDLIPGSASLPIGRGAIRLHDVDDRLGTEPAEVASAKGPFERMPELLFEGGPNIALRAFLADKGFPPDSAQLELFSDVMGDPRIERVLIVSTFVVVAGGQLAGGFRYLDLPVAMAADVKRVELDDLTQDGKAEIIVTMSEKTGDPRALTRRVYRWDGSRIVPYVEPSTAPQAAQAQAIRNVSTKASTNVSTTSLASSRPTQRHALEHPKPPGMDQLVAAYREARGVDASVQPRFLTHVNVAEDKALESLMLFGKELLVVGRSFRGGTGFFYFGLPVVEGSQVQRMFTADVTGDGRRELFVRFKQLIGDVQREILLAYTFDDQGMQPILATEVRRAQGDKSVGNVVRIVKAPGSYALRIRPGAAQGYTQETYPFVTEATDSYGPLRLPWLDREALYRFDGSRLVVSD